MLLNFLELIHRLTHRQHLISFVEDEDFDRVRLQSTALDHVVDTTRGSDNDVNTILENLHIITNDGSSDTSVAFNVHKVTDGDDDLLDLLSKLTGRGQDQSLALFDIQIDLLKNRDGESSGLSCSGLCLGDNITICCRIMLGLECQSVFVQAQKKKKRVTVVAMQGMVGMVGQKRGSTYC